MINDDSNHYYFNTISPRKDFTQNNFKFNNNIKNFLIYFYIHFQILFAFMAPSMWITYFFWFLSSHAWHVPYYFWVVLYYFAKIKIQVEHCHVLISLMPFLMISPQSSSYFMFAKVTLYHFVFIYYLCLNPHVNFLWLKRMF